MATRRCSNYRLKTDENRSLESGEVFQGQLTHASPFSFLDLEQSALVAAREYVRVNTRSANSCYPHPIIEPSEQSIEHLSLRPLRLGAPPPHRHHLPRGRPRLCG